ncbi:MAG TPA: HAMP domain-containing sensor histidine kinase [Acidimicrobiales bacterium]|nr:HAMP domain-containing sensor histidine kinase [Acidimicrobiales bacterium]
MRITLAAVAVTAVAVGLVGWLILTSFEDAQMRDVRVEADHGVDALVARLGAGQDPAAAVAAGGAGALGDVRVSDERGRVVASGAGPAVHAPVDTLTRTVDTPAGTLTVTAEVPVDQVERSTAFLTRRLALGLPALVVLVGAAAWVLVGRALRPVEAIRAEVEQITGSTMHRRVPEPASGDEVGRLARTMNTMLGRLEGAVARQRRFVSDASHELRSPVAVLRAGLELARGRCDQPDVRETLDSLLAEEARLEALLDDLLLLAAHEEGGGGPVPAQRVDLASLAAAEAGRPRRVPVTLVSAPDGVVTGARSQLARVLSNLVDNAARHAASGIEITLSSGDGRVRVVVDDDGPGIPPADRTRVFERFTRLDEGRDRNAGGTGLGLAVVRAIVTGHGGTVAAGQSPRGGARFVADLPATGAEPA